MPWEDIPTPQEAVSRVLREWARGWDLGQWITALGGLGLVASGFVLVNGQGPEAWPPEDPVGWAVWTGVSLLVAIAGFICHLVIRRRRTGVQPCSNLPR